MESSSSSAGKLSPSNYQTAICIAPPANLSGEIDRLRQLYDKGYSSWPPHINLIYPFVSIQNLERAIEEIRRQLLALPSSERAIRLCLDKPDFFSHRNTSTIYITDSNSNGGFERLKKLNAKILEAFKGSQDSYVPHLTIGQSGAQGASREYLLGKAALLPRVEWPVEELLVLAREHNEQGSRMRLWGKIDVSTCSISKVTLDLALLERDGANETHERHRNGLHLIQPTSAIAGAPSPEPQSTFRFSPEHSLWAPYHFSGADDSTDSPPETFRVATYNVLTDDAFPPSEERYSLLLRAILSEFGLADVLVLQEVSDDFLIYLLANDTIRTQYAFATHAPANQPDAPPLPSLRNVVALSRHAFHWEYLPFKQRHKGAVVLEFPEFGLRKEQKISHPLIVAGIHLTRGLADDTVAAKQSQLQVLTNHLKQSYTNSPWIVAGDFNLTTSSATIATAEKSKSISTQTAAMVSTIESLITNVGLADTWMIARIETGYVGRRNDGTGFHSIEDLYDGEEGATFDPSQNVLAAQTSLGGVNSRPQRYDRILIKNEGWLQASDFNMFGFPEDLVHVEIDNNKNELPYGSDHWGIRATLKTNASHEEETSTSRSIALSRLELLKAPSIFSTSRLRQFLTTQDMFPTDKEISKRREVFTLLEAILQDRQLTSLDDSADTRSYVLGSKGNVSLVVAPVGSYGLGVWSASSDIDCLCIGSISAKTFFALASQRLRKASSHGVSILRKVKAASGTMLELEVQGVRADLQYCPATRVAETWPKALTLQPDDPLFDLSIQSLTKLQPLRDISYLQRTVPDLPSFRLAYRFLRLWATNRGIYSSKFGYFGGIHITLLLSRICKMLSWSAGAISTPDLLFNFFAHYAVFDWAKEMAFDQFFSDAKINIKYHRTTREPIVILGLHKPLMNVAHTATPHSVRTLTDELKRGERLMKEGSSWNGITDGASGEFLTSYNSFIKIGVNVWGSSSGPSSWMSLLGWLESRCPLLLTELDRKVPSVHARIWPARFCAKDEAVSVENSASIEKNGFSGCYLIGLARNTSSSIEMDPKATSAALQAALDRFSEAIRSDERYFDPSCAWVEVTRVRALEVADLVPDSRSWVAAQVGELDDSSDSDDEELDSDEAELLLSLEQESSSTKSKKNATKSKSHQLAQRPSGPKAPKLRPASDVLNRLRWDPALDADDFVVGYEDRFLGVRETALGKWKTEQTDEEFIPQHRVVYFKRRSDGIIVWDREKRIDRVFGTGLGAGESMDASKGN